MNAVAPRLATRAAIAWIVVAGLAYVLAYAPARAEDDCFDVTRALRAGGTAPAAPGSAESTDCWYSIHVHAVRVSDCCAGGRTAAIDPAQVARWVGKANEVYAAARVRIEFDPTPGTGDWAEWNDTNVNNLVSARPGDAVWERAKTAANEMASHYPDKILVLFRHGPGSEPTGGGFSSNKYDFVVMPPFRATTACGEQNVFLFAHELGHYLGLKHTFREFRTKTEAAEALKRARLDPRFFDGDGLEDTPPDPYIKEISCDSVGLVLLDGAVFTPPTNNVMCYYPSKTKTITPQQAAIVRATIERRFANARDNVGPYMPDPRRAVQILSLEDGTVLEADPGATGDGSPVRRGRWSGEKKQTWKMVPLVAQDAGWLEIVSPATGRCLTVPLEGGAPVLAEWIGAENQKWRLVQDEIGDLYLEAKHDRKVLAAAGPSSARLLETAPDAGSQNQRWRLLPGE